MTKFSVGFGHFDPLYVAPVLNRSTEGISTRLLSRSRFSGILLSSDSVLNLIVDHFIQQGSNSKNFEVSHFLATHHRKSTAGSDIFKAEQLSRTFEVKVPPFEQCQITQENGGWTIAQDEDWPQLTLRMAREHALVWNLNGTFMSAPEVATCWIPYDYEAIMRYGHAVNSSIPEDPIEEQFPPAPWSDRVIIKIKSSAAARVLAAPLPAGGDPQKSPPAPGLPST
jgi:hypothetical protein